MAKKSTESPRKVVRTSRDKTSTLRSNQAAAPERESTNRYGARENPRRHARDQAVSPHPSLPPGKFAPDAAADLGKETLAPNAPYNRTYGIGKRIESVDES